jgi:hypothetical protein
MSLTGIVLKRISSTFESKGKVASTVAKMRPAKEKGDPIGSPLIQNNKESVDAEIRRSL